MSGSWPPVRPLGRYSCYGIFVRFGQCGKTVVAVIAEQRREGGGRVAVEYGVAAYAAAYGRIHASDMFGHERRVDRAACRAKRNQRLAAYLGVGVACGYIVEHVAGLLYGEVADYGYAGHAQIAVGRGQQTAVVERDRPAVQHRRDLRYLRGREAYVARLDEVFGQYGRARHVGHERVEVNVSRGRRPVSEPVHGYAASGGHRGQHQQPLGAAVARREGRQAAYDALRAVRVGQRRHGAAVDVVCREAQAEKRVAEATARHARNAHGDVAQAGGGQRAHDDAQCHGLVDAVPAPAAKSPHRAVDEQSSDREREQYCHDRVCLHGGVHRRPALLPPVICSCTLRRRRWRLIGNVMHWSTPHCSRRVARCSESRASIRNTGMPHLCRWPIVRSRRLSVARERVEAMMMSENSSFSTCCITPCMDVVRTVSSARSATAEATMLQVDISEVKINILDISYRQNACRLRAAKSVPRIKKLKKSGRGIAGKVKLSIFAR